MNLVLLLDHEIVDAERALIGAERARHLVEIIGVRPGQTLRVGREGQGVGEGTVRQIDEEGLLVEIAFRIDDDGPPPPTLDLLLALPRPKILQRLLEHAPGLGLRRIVLVRSNWVDRSYFSSPRVHPEAINEALTRGMEQARVVHRPEVRVEPLFRPYVEDRLSSERGDRPAVVLHPHPAAAPFRGFEAPAAGSGMLAVGPERGWTDFEVGLLEQAGFVPASLGSRIFRVETAVVWACALALATGD